MSLENWGGMSKSQDNSQSIDQAIVFAIAEHEADPESHMGDGESIENHRINEVIDHPQSSVPADKITTAQFIITTVFETVGGWSISANSTWHQFGSLGLGTTTTLNNQAYAYLEETGSIYVRDFDKNLMFQTTFNDNGQNSGDIDIILAVVDDIATVLGMGFRVINGVVSGLFNDGETLHTVQLGNLSAGVNQTVRAFINQSSGNVEFWLNGILLGTIAYVRLYDSDEMCGFKYNIIKKRTAYSASLVVQSLTLAKDII